MCKVTEDVCHGFFVGGFKNDSPVSYQLLGIMCCRVVVTGVLKWRIVETIKTKWQNKGCVFERLNKK